MRFAFACALVAVTAACSPPSPQPQPNEMETVNATRVDEAAPAGALGNESGNYAEGNVTPAEREQIRQPESAQPEQVVAQYANLIVQRRFEEAYQMWAPQAASFTAEQMEQEFSPFETMQAAIGQMQDSPAGGEAAQQSIQLTLSGTRQDGSRYVITGPVTVQRMNAASGSGEGQWQVVKTVLVGDPQLIDALINQ